MRRHNEFSQSGFDSQASDLLDAAVERLETSWQASIVPDLDSCLVDVDGALRARVLIELIKVDQEHRWPTDRRQLLETYLEQWPELSSDLGAITELLAAECLTRAVFDAPLSMDELRQRFPEAAEQIDLEAIRECAHQEISDGQPETRFDRDSTVKPQFGSSPDSPVQFSLPGGGTFVCREGAALGDYRIVSRLGCGGMGLVYKAKHTRTDHVVALKILPPDLTQYRELVTRFRREATVIDQLAHSNVITAHDAGESDGLRYLVMEYVDGIDLASLVQRHGPLSVDQAVDAVLQAARGLQHAHRNGVIHRDVKPSNLIIETAGARTEAADEFPRVKILDMGLARLVMPTGELTVLTDTNAMIGTVDFMAPEQARNPRRAVAAADIYSLGMTLWFLLTGRVAYTASGLVAKLVAHQKAPIPSLCDACPEVPESLDAVFQKMVAKDVADRYQSMDEVIAGLLEFTL